MANLSDAFSGMYTQIRHIMGFTTEEEKKQYAETGQQVQDAIQENKDANGGEYSYIDSIPAIGNLENIFVIGLVTIVFIMFLKD